MKEGTRPLFATAPWGFGAPSVLLTYSSIRVLSSGDAEAREKEYMANRGRLNIEDLKRMRFIRWDEVPDHLPASRSSFCTSSRTSELRHSGRVGRTHWTCA